MSVHTKLRKRDGYIRVAGRDVCEDHFVAFLSIEDAEKLVEKLTAEIAAAKGEDRE